MRLYNAVRLLGLPELYDVPTTDCPFIVSSYSEKCKGLQSDPRYPDDAGVSSVVRKSAIVGSDAGPCKEYVGYSQP